MPGFPDCPACDFADDPRVCHALAVGVRRYCELIHNLGREDYRELVRARTLDPAWETPPSPDNPGPMARAATFAGALVRHVAAGMPTVDAAEKARRLAICDACPNYRPDSGTCGLCGCNLAIKASWSLESCPDTPPRWSALPSPEPLP